MTILLLSIIMLAACTSLLCQPPNRQAATRLRRLRTSGPVRSLPDRNAKGGDRRQHGRADLPGRPHADQCRRIQPEENQQRIPAGLQLRQRGHTVDAPALRRSSLKLKLGVVLCGAMVATAASGTARSDDAAKPPQKDWHFNISPYVWAAGLKGTVATVPGLPPIKVDASFSDVLRNLDLAAMVAANPVRWHRRRERYLHRHIRWVVSGA
jgi:hypothetical protein